MIPLYVLCGLFVVALLYREREHDRQTSLREDAWRLERSGLITRIQHPEFIVAAPETPAIPDEDYLTEEVDESDLVGTIQMNGNG
jgi:hypothetical protein